MLQLERQEEKNNTTFGKLFLVDENNPWHCEKSAFLCHTIERPWRNNQTGISCIRPGLYGFTFLPRSGSGKYRRVYHLDEQDTAPRSQILIHAANWWHELRGCIAPNTWVDDVCGHQSRAALNKVREAVGEEAGEILIRSRY